MSRAQLTSTVEQNTGGAVSPYVAGKNFIINGAMEIWQRGTSFTPSAVGYCADRWSFNNNSAATLSRQTTSLTNFQYALRVQRNSGSTSTSQISVYESLETVSIYPLIGQTITMSFWARAGANFSPSSSAMGAYVYSGTGTDQNIQNGYTSAAVVAGGNSTLTTTWTKYSVTGTVGSSITELALGFTHNPIGTAGANDWFEVTGVQLELGSVATPFSRAGGTLSGELTACQRYYYQPSNTSANIGVMGAASTTGVARLYIAVPVPMRGNTASVSYTGTPQLYDGVATISVTSIAFNTISENQLNINIGVASGLTQYRPYSLYLNGGTILVSSEL